MRIPILALFIATSVFAANKEEQSHIIGGQFNTNILGNTFGVFYIFPVSERFRLQFNYETGSFQMSSDRGSFPLVSTQRGTDASVDVDINHFYNAALLFQLRKSEQITWFRYIGLGLAGYNFEIEHSYTLSSGNRAIGSKRYNSYGGLVLLDIFEYRPLAKQITLNIGIKIYGILMSMPQELFYNVGTAREFSDTLVSSKNRSNKIWPYPELYFTIGFLL